MFSHNKCNLGTLFGTPLDTKTLSYFQVPKYQRKFDWEKEKQISKLIDDIYQNMGKSYFMGPIIICSRYGTKSNSVELIDGQQRLATFAIFIRSLIDYIEHRRSDPSFPQNLFESMFRIKFELESKILKGSQQNEVVIHLPRKINSFFRTEIIIKNDNNRAASLEKAKRGQHPSVKRLIDAYIKIWESLKERFDDKNGELLLVELTNLKDSLLNEKEFLVLTVEDEGDAYTIFETINERAKPLTQSDLVKNLLFKRMDILEEGNILDDFEDQWDDAEVNVADFPSFMWHAWVSRQITCPKNKLFQALQEYIKDKDIKGEQAFDFATDLILKEVKYYHNYENPDEEEDEEKRKYLKMLKTMDASRCYPLLLSIDSARNPDNITAKEANNILEIITCLTFWYSGTCSRDAKSLEKTYHDLAREIRRITKENSKPKLQELNKALQDNFPSQNECRAAFTTRGFSDIQFIKMVLENIERNQYHKTETTFTLKGKKDVQLEHILPRNPDPEWKNNFINDKEMEEYTYRFGNYTLLYGSINKDARNSIFSKKKEEYKKSDICLTKALLNIDAWNTTEIDKRTFELFEQAQLIWPIYPI